MLGDAAERSTRSRTSLRGQGKSWQAIHDSWANPLNFRTNRLTVFTFWCILFTSIYVCQFHQILFAMFILARPTNRLGSWWAPDPPRSTSGRCQEFRGSRQIALLCLPLTFLGTKKNEFLMICWFYFATAFWRIPKVHWKPNQIYTSSGFYADSRSLYLSHRPSWRRQHTAVLNLVWSCFSNGPVCNATRWDLETWSKTCLHEWRIEKACLNRIEWDRSSGGCGVMRSEKKSKIARRSGEKHICKWKCWKTDSVGPLFAVPMSENCTPSWREAHLQVKMLKTDSAGPLFAVPMSKNCTPLWREAYFQVKMSKARQLRTTFWISDVKNLHATVARSTCVSQNVQNTCVLAHFLNFRCRKIVNQSVR